MHNKMLNNMGAKQLLRLSFATVEKTAASASAYAASPQEALAGIVPFGNRQVGGMKNLLIVFLLCCFSVAAHSQATKIQGTVADESGNAIDLFDVAVLRADSSVIAASVFMNGSFGITIPDTVRAVLLRVRSMGYQQAFHGIPRSAQDSITDMGCIKLSAESVTLNEVVVKAQRPQMRLEGDTYIVDVSKTYLAKAGMFIDVARRIPGLEVSGRGGISVMGKPRLLITLNGRYIRSMAEVTALQSHQIKSISIDRNPSVAFASSYDAVVNVTTVDAIQDYMLLTVTDNATFGRKVSNSAGVTLNGKYKKLSYFTNMGYANGGSQQYDTEEKALWTESKGLETLRHSQIALRGQGFGLSQSFEYQLRPQTFLGVGYNLSISDQNQYKNQDFHAFSLGQEESVPMASRTKANSVGHNPTLYLVHKGEKSSLNVYADYYGASSESTQDITESGERKAPYVFSDHYHVGGVKVDYSRTLSFLTYNAGGKFSYIKDNGEYASGTADLQYSSQESFSYAAYLNAGKSVKPFYFAAGLRFESERIKSANNGVTALDTTYVNLFPYASVSYSKNGFRSSLTYSRRISRPSYGQLIMKSSYIDPLSYSIGNPLLKSTLTDVLSLSVQKGNFIGTLSYLYYSNNRAQVAMLDEGQGDMQRVKFMYENIPHQHAFQLYAVYYYNFGKMRGNSTLMLTSSSMKYGQKQYASYGDISVYAKTSLETPLWKEATLMMTLRYRNARYSNFYFMKSYFDSSLYLSQNLFGNKVKLTVGAEDLFKTVKSNHWTQNLPFANIRMATDEDSRLVSVSLRYMFGKSKAKSHSQSSIQEEKGRL